MQAFRLSLLSKTLLVSLGFAVLAGCDAGPETLQPPQATAPTPAPAATVPAAAPNAAAPASPAQPVPAASPAQPAPAASPATPPPALTIATPQPGTASPAAPAQPAPAASPAQPGIAISPATTGQPASPAAAGGTAPTRQSETTAQTVRCDTAAYVADISWQGGQPRMNFTRKPSEVVLSNAPITVKANPDQSATYAAAGTSTTYARIFPDGTCFVQVVGGNGAVALEESGRTR